MRNHPIQDSEQNVLNKAMDSDFDALVVSPGEYDGHDLQRPESGLMAQKIVESSGYTYICKAPPGTAQSTALWRCKRIDQTVSGTTVITWADGNINFDNVATDPTSLTYS